MFCFRTDDKAPQNRKVTDFFPIRRSNRKTKGELKVGSRSIRTRVYCTWKGTNRWRRCGQQDEEHRHIEDLIKNGAEEGMQVALRSTEAGNNRSDDRTDFLSTSNR